MTKKRIWAAVILMCWFVVLVAPNGVFSYDPHSPGADEVCRRVGCDGAPVVRGLAAVRTPALWAGLLALSSLAAVALRSRSTGAEVVIVGAFGTVGLAYAMLMVDEQSVLRSYYGVSGNFKTELKGSSLAWMAWVWAVFATMCAGWSLRRGRPGGPEPKS